MQEELERDNGRVINEVVAQTLKVYEKYTGKSRLSVRAMVT